MDQRIGQVGTAGGEGARVIQGQRLQSALKGRANDQIIITKRHIKGRIK